MRPLTKEEDGGEPIVQKISANSLSILDHAFTFDSIADMESTQVRFLDHKSSFYENVLTLLFCFISARYIRARRQAAGRELLSWLQQFYICIWTGA